VKVQRFDFVGRLDGATRTPQGGIRAKARLSRTGVFLYRNADGSERRELRTPEEVFRADSLDTIRGAPITIGHPGMVTSESWKRLAVGHVGDDPHAVDNKFIEATVYIQDSATCAKVERGELVEVSMGYEVELEPRAGEYEGEKFDAVQKAPRYNHVALGGVDWGRAGRDVRVVLDAACLGSVDMTTPALPVSIQRFDAPTNEQLNKDLEAARAESESLRKERDAARTDLASERKRADGLEAERDSLKKDVTKAREDADPAKVEERVAKRIDLVESARRIDAKIETKGKSDRDVRVAAIFKVDPEFKADGKSDDYVAARFDIACGQVTTERAALGTVNQTTVQPAKTAGEKSRLDEAYEKRDAERAEDAKGGPPRGAMTKESK